MSKPIPLIVGFGGLSSAGKSVFHLAYQRIIIDDLPASIQQETYASLACLMGLVRFDKGSFFHNSTNQEISLAQITKNYASYIKKNTLIRKLQGDFPQNSTAKLSRELAQKLQLASTGEVWGKGWSLDQNQKIVLDEDSSELEILLSGYKANKVGTAAQLPTGFHPSNYYNSLHHPKYIQQTIFGVSDAIRSLGLDWQEVQDAVAMDKIGVYCGSCTGGTDERSIGGLMQAAHLGKRPSSKMLAFSMQNMLSDFINAYVLGSIGITNTSIGACATFLYNLSNAVQDIRNQKIEVAIVGSSESPIVPEIIEGYRVMSALADDEKIKKMNNGILDHRSACRPFGNNCGFTLAEGCQFVILFSDKLALKLGAKIYSAIGDIFVSADGYKGSISQPGVGNYVTFAKGAALIKKLLGIEKLRKNSYIHAHGTGTPQNRVSESHILNETAKAFGIEDWKVTAIKTYLGHSTGPAAGDQLMACLGAWEHNIIAAIEHTPKIADDVHQSHLNILLQNQKIEKNSMLACLINSKGFGGNNSTGVFFSPNLALELLEKRASAKEFASFQQKSEQVEKAITKKKDSLVYSTEKAIYSFQHQVLSEAVVKEDSVYFEELGKKISLEVENPYE